MKLLTDESFQKLISGALKTAIINNKGALHKKQIGLATTIILSQINGALIQFRSQEFLKQLDERALAERDRKIKELEESVNNLRKQRDDLLEKLKASDKSK